MSILAEEIVEEWLNRNGYFTIRGIKLGVHEIDLLAIRMEKDGSVTRRHLEVQASVNPTSYVTGLPKRVRKQTGRSSASSKHREDAELIEGVKESCEKKYKLPKKSKLRLSLSSGDWTFELVVHRIKYPHELKLIRAEGVIVHRLSKIAKELARTTGPIAKAAGGDLVDLLVVKT